MLHSPSLVLPNDVHMLRHDPLQPRVSLSYFPSHHNKRFCSPLISVPNKRRDNVSIAFRTQSDKLKEKFLIDL